MQTIHIKHALWKIHSKLTVICCRLDFYHSEGSVLRSWWSKSGCVYPSWLRKARCADCICLSWWRKSRGYWVCKCFGSYRIALGYRKSHHSPVNPSLPLCQFSSLFTIQTIHISKHCNNSYLKLTMTCCRPGFYHSEGSDLWRWWHTAASYCITLGHGKRASWYCWIKELS
jgi:hypothetical protein